MSDNNEHVGNHNRLDNDSGVTNSDSVDCPITTREQEILGCAASGMQAQDTADYLNISRRTVEAHLLNARIKLLGRNTTNAVAIAMRRGIIAGLSLVILANAMFGSVSVIRPRTGGGSARVSRTMARRVRRRNNGSQKT